MRKTGLGRLARQSSAPLPSTRSIARSPGFPFQRPPSSLLQHRRFPLLLNAHRLTPSTFVALSHINHHPPHRRPLITNASHNYHPSNFQTSVEEKGMIFGHQQSMFQNILSRTATLFLKLVNEMKKNNQLSIVKQGS